MSAVEKFPILLSDAEEETSAVPPCFSDEGINVCHPFIGLSGLGRLRSLRPTIGRRVISREGAHAD